MFTRVPTADVSKCKDIKKTFGLRPDFWTASGLLDSWTFGLAVHNRYNSPMV